jgi:hypothetical protein
MSRNDYEALAVIVGNTLYAAYCAGGENVRTAIHDSLYRPLVSLLKADNSLFDQGKFAYAVGVAEGKANRLKVEKA